MKKESEEGTQPVITKPYTARDLRVCWEFCQHDFERFLELLFWMESLDAKERSTQLETARYCVQARGKVSSTSREAAPNDTPTSGSSNKEEP